MFEGDPEREEQREEQTRQPAPEAPDKEGVPPPPDDEEVREGVEKGTEEALKPEEEED